VALRGYKPTVEGHPGQIKKAAKLVDAAQRPIILAGHGVIASGGAPELKAFAEKAGIPVVTTFLGIGSFPQDHALSYSWMGMHGAFYANHAANDADVVLGIGMRFDDRAMGRFRDFNPNAQIIHIDIDPAEIGKNFKTAVPIVGDVKHVLTDLIDEVKPNSHVEWIRWLDEMRRDHPSFIMPDTDEIAVQYVIEQIDEATHGDAVIVTGVGQHQMWVGQHYTFRFPRQLITSGGLGTMGFEVPAALGAQMARPDKVVWSICGDGGFQMTSQELATIVDQRAPVKLAIMNNGFLGMIRQWQELFFDNRLSGVDLEGNPDFVKLAGAYGIKGWRIRRPAEVDRILKAAMAYDEGPCLVEAEVIKEDNVFPMIPAGAGLKDMLIERPKQKMAKPEGST
jgi:acetolactate synthase I/II/III large subunit